MTSISSRLREIAEREGTLLGYRDTFDGKIYRLDARERSDLSALADELDQKAREIEGGAWDVADAPRLSALAASIGEIA